jgi:hypothetical protein
VRSVIVTFNMTRAIFPGSTSRHLKRLERSTCHSFIWLDFSRTSPLAPDNLITSSLGGLSSIVARGIEKFKSLECPTLVLPGYPDECERYPYQSFSSMVLALSRSLAITRLVFRPTALASRRAPYYHTSYSTITQKRTTKMSDKEEPSAKLDLDYTSERAEELKENIEAVQKEIDEVWAEVEGQGGAKVSSSSSSSYLFLSIAAADL